MIDSVSEGAGAAPDLTRTRRRKPSNPNGGARVDRLPPHSIEAEQGVLGCVMLSPNESMGICIERFKDGAEVFYDLRHQTIYSALADMYDKREPIDLITVQQQLKNAQLLDQVGGLAYLAYYVDIVREKYILRRMIHTCTDVVGRVYDFEGEVDGLLDEVERDILRISESRVTGESKGIKQLVHKAFDTIENYFNR